MTFDDRRALALAILTKGTGLTTRSAQFAGQLCVPHPPLTDKQETWFWQIVERAGVDIPKGLQHDE